MVIPGGRYLSYLYTNNGQTALPILVSFETTRELHRWAPRQGWAFDTKYSWGLSANGKFAATILQEDVGGQPPADYNPVNPRYRIGLIDLTSLELKWVGEVSGHGSSTIRQIAVSNDGKYVAVGGWNNGVAMIDSSQGKVLWADRPPTEVSTGYVLFSSDGLKLYSAGSEGCVYTTETLAGKITGQWWATETGRSIYGHRVSCLANSPDGRWMAAGTGPEGHVYLYDAVSMGRPRLLIHGLQTIEVVTFSPDSKYLASVGGGRIKIWSLADMLPVPETPLEKPSRSVVGDTPSTRSAR
jgi:WD40 repeat protein